MEAGTCSPLDLSLSQSNPKSRRGKELIFTDTKLEKKNSPLYINGVFAMALHCNSRKTGEGMGRLLFIYRLSQEHGKAV